MEAEKAYLELAKAIDEAKSIPPCMQTDPEIFFSGIDDQPSLWQQAVKFCQTCPVIQQCATYAIVANEQHGVWGGLTPMKRQAIRRGRSLGSLPRSEGLEKPLHLQPR
jgi:WhiB family redox-sensing transcriptional regulator